MATSTGEAKGAKDGKTFYGYLYDKPTRKGEQLPCPTPTLDALLRAICLHIVCRATLERRGPSIANWLFRKLTSATRRTHT